MLLHMYKLQVADFTNSIYQDRRIASKCILYNQEA